MQPKFNAWTVTPEVAFRKTDYDRMLSEVRQLFQENGTLTVAQVRDHFQTSRRYVLAFLEHLDAIGVTARKGDVRILEGWPLEGNSPSV